MGIITDRDIAMGAALQHRLLWEIRGEEITRGRELICCHPDDSIQSALELMERHEIRRLPVINQHQQLCGMVSMGDIVSFTGKGRARKGDGDQIAADDTLDFLRHISAHHTLHKGVAAG